MQGPIRDGEGEARLSRPWVFAHHTRWRSIPEHTVGPLVVVVVPPSRQLLPRFLQGSKPFHVQAFISSATVKALDEAVLHWPSRSDEDQLHPVLHRPGFQDPPRELTAIRKAALNRAHICDAVRELSPWDGASGAIVWDPVGENVRKIRLGRIQCGRVVPLPQEVSHRHLISLGNRRSEGRAGVRRGTGATRQGHSR